MLSSPDIYRAEQTRISLNHRAKVKQVEAMRDRCYLTPTALQTLPKDQLPNLMRELRIGFGNLMSLSQVELLGSRSWSWLREARDIARRLYYDPTIWGAALNMESDPEGHPYFMASEMCRDRGKYDQKANGLRLRPSKKLLAEARSYFFEAVSLSPKKTSVNSLATMELLSTERMLGKRMRFGKFLKSYHEVLEIEGQNGNQDRRAAVSWALVLESLLAGDKKHLEVGLHNLLEITSALGVDWKRHYLAKEIIKQTLGISWRLTSPKLPDFELLIGK